MASNREAYVDTSAFIAFFDRSDAHHELFKQLFANPPRLITTALVLGEGHAWFLRRYNRQRALQFLGLVRALSPLTTQPMGRDEYEGAVAILRKFADQDLTLADTLGLYTMQTCKTDACWSTDFHLGLTGVPLAIHGT